jgi:hypothetical protein
VGRSLVALAARGFALAAGFARVVVVFVGVFFAATR